MYSISLSTIPGCIKVIKHVWKQPRPSLNCAYLDTCNTYGMPSSHTQLIFFQCTWALLVARCRTRHPTGTLDALLVACGCALATLVGASRVVLGYHSVEQVLVGAAAGVATAVVWFGILTCCVQPVFATTVQRVGALRRLCNALQLHDSLAATKKQR